MGGLIQRIEKRALVEYNNIIPELQMHPNLQIIKFVDSDNFVVSERLFMIITYQGNSYFKIQSGPFTTLVDPVNSRSFKGADVVIKTKTKAEQNDEEEDGIFWITNQGEYEIGGARVEGWGTAFEKNEMVSAYRMELEDMSLGIVGPLDGEPDPECIERLQDVDILLVPGERGLLKFVRQLEPGVVIPYGEKGKVKTFFNELGQSPKPEEKLVIKKKEISPGKIQGVALAV